MRVRVFICPKCQTGVFARTAKDFRTCTCFAMGITGTPEAPRISAGSALAPKIKVAELNFKASAETFQEDWENMVDEYGIIPKTDARLKTCRPLKPEELSAYVQASIQSKGPGEGGEDLEGDLDEDEATVSAEEVNQFISSNKNYLKATDSAGQIKEAGDSLKQQKLSQIFSQKFQDLKQKASVKIF